MYNLAIFLEIVLIVWLPIVAAYYVHFLLMAYVPFSVSLLFSVLTYFLSYIVLSGLLSQLGKSAVKKGKFERSLHNSLYGRRRLHAVPWTLLYYFTPLYFVILVFKPLRTFTFWLFGYKGSYNFTAHPDTWLRDVPCLTFGEGTYLANKSTVAANMVLMQGKLLVDNITVGARSCVGMGAMVGPGAEIGEDSIVDTSSLVGVRARIGDKVRVNGLVGVQHGAVIEDEAHVGANSFIGIRARIGKGVVIPECAYVEAAVRLKTQAEADEYFEKETENLIKLRLQVLEKASALRAESKLKIASSEMESSDVPSGSLS